MGKLVVTEFVTLDGVFQDPGGSGEFDRRGWSFKFNRGPEGDKFKLDELTAAEAMLLGRITYEGFAQAWPSIKDDVGFADKMNNLPKYLVSTTLDHGTWNNTTVIRANVPEEVRKLKESIEGDILIAGSGRLVNSLMPHNLIDEYHLMVYPIVLGAGKRLFSDTNAPTSLRLVDTTKLGDIVVLTYQPQT